MALRNPVAVVTSNKSDSKVAAHLSIPADLAARISRQVPSWSTERLATCTYSKGHSSFPECRAELEIFDVDSKNVIHGREFNDSRRFFWDA